MAAISAALLLAMSFIGMLVNRNLEIEAQTRNVQLRESELLAAEAEEALLIGDTLRAVECAVSALPKEGDEDRPYYAPAESALMEATDILGGSKPPVLLKALTLEQMTPITHFTLSADGALAVTIDDYGVIHCCDTVSGTECWSDVVTGPDSFVREASVVVSNDNHFLFCSYNGLMECRELRTGKVLWSSQSKYDYNSYIYDYQQNRMALIHNYSNAQLHANLLEMTLLNGASGEILSRITLDQTDYNITYSLSSFFSTQHPEKGVFSDDGRYFAYAIPQRDSGTENTVLSCFVVDLVDTQVILEYHQDMPDDQTYLVSAIDMRGDHLFLALESSNNAIAATIMKLNWRSGELLWSTTTPAELEQYTALTRQTASILFWDTVALLGRYERLYSIDLSTGEMLSSIQLSNALNYMYTVSSHYFGFSLSDGTYAIGWHTPNSGFTLSTDPLMQVSADIGPHTLMKPYQGGIVQLYTDGDYIELSVSNVEREGFLAYVCSSTPNHLTIKRPITVLKPVEQDAITLPVEQDTIHCWDADPIFCTNNTLILGSFSVDLEDDSRKNFYAAVNRETHQVTKIFEVEDSYSQKLYFLPDGSGYLLSDEGCTWLKKEESSVLIAENTDPSCPGNDFYVNNLIATDTVRLADGNLLTAHCDSDSLILMINGEKKEDIPLPLEHCYSFAPDLLRYRKVFPGKNQNVLTICHTYEGPFPSEYFALYNPDIGWLSLNEEFTLTNTDALAFSSGENQLALADDSNQVRLFDLTSGTQTAVFPLQLPSSSVLFMDYIMTDAYLLVKTKDAHSLIYDPTSGDIIFHDKLGSTFSGILRTYIDAENQRLYLIDSEHSADPNCLCIDLRSWTTLGTSTKVLCFDEITGELIHFDYHHDTQDSLSCLRVPSTQELVLLGQQMLAAE